MLFPRSLILGEDSIGHLSDFPFRVSSQLKMGIFEIGISKIPILVRRRTYVNLDNIRADRDGTPRWSERASTNYALIGRR